MASIKLSPHTSCCSSSFDEDAIPPAPVNRDEFRASVKRINAEIKTGVGFWLAIASIPIFILLAVVCFFASVLANISGIGILAVLFFSLPSASCCMMGMIKKKFTPKFFAIVAKENAYFAGRVPSVQYRVETHENHMLHIRTGRGYASAATSIVRTYDLHLDVDGGSPIALVMPVLAFAQPQYQPQYQGQANGNMQMSPMHQQQQIQQPQRGMYQRQSEFGGGGSAVVQPMAFAPQQYAQYAPPQYAQPPQYAAAQPPAFSSQPYNLSDQLLERQPASDE